MNTDITVSLDNFFLLELPSYYANNYQYIGSSIVKVLGQFAIGSNLIYKFSSSNFYVLKAVLKDDILLVDNSFDDPDFIDEQLLILEFVGTPAKIQYVCLWTYFNLPSVEEINRISLQVTKRKVDEFNNPDKIYYYKCLDNNVFNGTYDEWIVEIDTLFEKWKNCEKLRLEETGYNSIQIDDYIRNRSIETFKRQYSNNDIKFYIPKVHTELETLYNESLQILAQVTSMDVETVLPEEGENLETYIKSILNFSDENSDLNSIVNHATVVYNHYRSIAVSSDSELIDYPF